MTTEFKPPQRLRPLLSDLTKPIIHRDLSWLQFNGRVLAEADSDSNPLLERVKFLAISSANLDEFFIVRIASLGRTIAVEMRRNNEFQLRRLRRIRSVILANVSRTLAHQAETLDTLALGLEGMGVHIIKDPLQTARTRELAKKVFDEKVLGEIQPPEPFAINLLNTLENMQMALCFAPGAWIRIPKRLKTVFSIRDELTGDVFVFFLDRLLLAFVGDVFGIDSKAATIVRLARDADLTVDLEEEDTESIPDVVRTNLSKRERGRPVRLQYTGRPDRLFLKSARSTLKLSPQQIFEIRSTLCLHGLWSILHELPAEVTAKPGLTYPPPTALLPKEFSGGNTQLFEFLRKRDFLLHHPYDSFEAYVEWIKAACDDPDVTMIQQTVYRMDALSPVIDALKSAGSRKKVRVVIELRARFDELNNLRLAEELRQAGVEVIFGFGRLKIHAKVALVTRREGGAERLYTHLSTGNYNSLTARQYTDLAIITANQEIGEDVRYFFETVAAGQVPTTFKRLIAAPTKLHRRIIQLIDSEIAAANAGKPARIVSKVNTLVDEAVVQQLYRASCAGVKIDLIVRGACSLVPGVTGLSENIRVISIVDRFLEHSRIYYFGSSRAMYLSSADWMPRNFFSRLELAFPVLDDSLYAYIANVIIPTYLGDNVKARELTSDGTWKPLHPAAGTEAFRSQKRFEELAKRLYVGTELE